MLGFSDLTSAARRQCIECFLIEGRPSDPTLGYANWNEASHGHLPRAQFDPALGSTRTGMRTRRLPTIRPTLWRISCRPRWSKFKCAHFEVEIVLKSTMSPSCARRMWYCPRNRSWCASPTSASGVVVAWRRLFCNGGSPVRPSVGVAPNARSHALSSSTKICLRSYRCLMARGVCRRLAGHQPLGRAGCRVREWNLRRQQHGTEADFAAMRFAEACLLHVATSELNALQNLAVDN